MKTVLSIVIYNEHGTHIAGRPVIIENDDQTEALKAVESAVEDLPLKWSVFIKHDPLKGQS